MLVILDCNVWITIALNSQLYYITELSEKGVLIGSSTELKNEITDVISRPKFNKYFSESYINKIIELHNFVTKDFNIGKLIKVTSDSKDDYLFALSSKSKADYLVTGDKLLLSVAKYKKTEIISLSRFKEILK